MTILNRVNIKTKYYTIEAEIHSDNFSESPYEFLEFKPNNAEIQKKIKENRKDVC